MKKIIGQRGKLMGMDYVRIMPQPQQQTVASFFLLDHFYERKIFGQKEVMHRGTGAHPHRGITTVTYVMKGESEHKDSMGHQAIVKSGGMQWMKAGSGIVHDEGASETFQKNGGTFHMMQFWVLLGEKEREDSPRYLTLDRDRIPQLVLDVNGSMLRILIGEFCVSRSEIPMEKRYFIYHLSLQANSTFFYTIPENTEMAILAAKGKLKIDGNKLKQSELFFFDEGGKTLKIENSGEEAVDAMLFGGESFDERFYSHGPFVMGDRDGIVRAFDDYYAGKYGEILD